MPELTTNFAVSTVATPPSPSTSGTSLVVAAGEGSRFPAAPFNAEIAPDGVQATPANAEVVRVTAKSTDTFTITRAQESSSARAVVAGDRIWAGVTKRTIADLEAHPGAFALTSLGCVGNGSTDDTVALQAALDAQRTNGLWLEGGGKTFVISSPIVLGPSAKLRAMTIKAAAGFAPADSNGAMVLNAQGTVLSFTAAASTDVFTTPTAHGLPADDVGVVFKGSSLPTGITAGRVYYARDRTSTTFKVAATWGGAAVNITADGSGTAYMEVPGLNKVYLTDVMINGNAVTGINGAAFSLQQQSELHKFRVDACPGTGLALGGQQAVFTNFESVFCGTGIALEGARFMYFYGVDIEGSNNLRAVHSRAASVFYPGEFGATSCAFYGVHLEGSDTNSVGFDLEAQSINMTIANVNCSFSLATQKLIYVHTSGGFNTSGYTLLDAWFSAATPGAPTAIDDDDRGHTVLAWDGSGTQIYRRHIASWLAPQGSASDSYPERQPVRIVRPDGGYLGWGGQRNNAESFVSQPGSGQTANQAAWMNTGGTAILGVTPTGALELTEQTDPATPAANIGRLYTKDVGGKTALMVRFPTGAVQQIAIEP